MMAVTLPVLIPRLGKSSGNCNFSTAALVAGNEYAVRFYNNGQPVPSPSVVITIAGRSDACGVCGGNNATCTGCDGVPNSGKVVDSCGTCGGSDGTCVLPFTISSQHDACTLLPVVFSWTGPSNHTVTSFFYFEATVGDFTYVFNASALFHL
jgi:hypothetical protein